MNPQWPTLQDRLNNPLTDELTALHQLKSVLPLSKYAQELYDELSDKSIREKDTTTNYNEVDGTKLVENITENKNNFVVDNVMGLI